MPALVPSLLLPLLAALPITLPAVASVEEACDPAHLAPMVSAQREQVPALLSELDRRAQVTLAEQRKHEPELARLDAAAVQLQATELRTKLLVIALVVVVVALGVSASRRRSKVLGLAAWSVAIAALVLGWQEIDRRVTVDGQRAALLSRQLALSACQMRIAETHATLRHAQLARCIHDLDEADEDVGAWLVKLKSGQPVTLEDVTKLHGELQEEMK